MYKNPIAFLVLMATSALGQGIPTWITFDGPPVQPPGSDYNVQQYFESGIWFRPLPGSDGFGRVWSNPIPGRPDNGTPYIAAAFGDSLAFSFQNGSLFGLASVDLAGYSYIVPNFTVNFIGYRTDGSTIATSFSGIGINFQTYNFGPEFSGLTRVEIPTYAWSLDNLYVVVPEPSTLALVGLGGFFLAVHLLRRRRSKQ